MKTLSLLLLLAGLAHGQTTTVAKMLYCSTPPDHRFEQCLTPPVPGEIRYEPFLWDGSEWHSLLNPSTSWSRETESNLNAELPKAAPKAKVDAIPAQQVLVPAELEGFKMSQRGGAWRTCHMADMAEYVDPKGYFACCFKINDDSGSGCWDIPREVSGYSPHHDTVSEGGSSGFSAPIPALRAMVAPAVTPSVTHGINVAWTNPTGTLTKNTVYSGTTSAGPFTAIFTSTTPITSYLDPMTTTNQGVQSCYVVTAWTTIESNQSTAVCQTFPVQPGIPSNVSAAPQ